MKTNQCNKCVRFNRFYIRGSRRYEKTNCGKCSINKNIVSSDDTCKKFFRKSSKIFRSKQLVRSVNNMLLEISQIRKRLEEEINEDEEM